jgi:hypothetical protein
MHGRFTGRKRSMSGLCKARSTAASRRPIAVAAHQPGLGPLIVNVTLALQAQLLGPALYVALLVSFQPESTVYV